MNDVYLALINRIRELTDNQVYNGQADSNATYPYAILKLTPVDGTESHRDDYMLEVSCWDRDQSPSHARAVALSEEVRNALIHYTYLGERVFIAVSRPFAGFIPDNDEQIKRYDVSATIRTYRR